MFPKLLDRLTRKPMRLGIGLMSGTSADGIDAALARITGCGPDVTVEFLDFTSVPYNSTQRKRVIDGFSANAEELCRLHSDLGAWFADAAHSVCIGHGISIDKVDYIASHGQTVYHIPPSGREHGCSLQLGCPSVIAEATGCVVVSDFRTRDLAAGGGGAPLVPLFDYRMFAMPGKRRVTLNIGGISNVTQVTDRLEDVHAFDTGPGNCLIDVVAGDILPNETCDRDGRLALAGKVDEELLAELLAHPYYAAPPPKTTGRELFTPAMARELLKRVGRDRAPDLCATLAALTARTIADAIKTHIGKVDEVIASGGGIHHPVMESMLKELLAPAKWRTTAEFGIPPDGREALAFALIGNETLFGLPGNVPSATGARHAVPLGSITPPTSSSRV